MSKYRGYFYLYHKDIFFNSNIEKYLFDKDFHLFYITLIKSIQNINTISFLSESAYHGYVFMYFYFNLMNSKVYSNYTIQHENNENPTKVDIYIETKNGLCIIIEIKRCKKGIFELKKSALNGFKQIFTKKYYDVLYLQNNQEIILTSMSFVDNEAFIFYSNPILYTEISKFQNSDLIKKNQVTSYDTLKNVEFIEIAPDTHVTQCSVKLGVITEKEAETLSKDAISNRWREVLKDSGIAPIEMHPPLWFWSRNGFIFKI